MKVAHITQLDKYVMHFSGRDLPDALRRADEWAKRLHRTITGYYVQIAFGGKSIIAGWRHND